MSVINRCAKMFSWIPSTAATVKKYLTDRLSRLGESIVKISSSSTVIAEKSPHMPRVLNVNLGAAAIKSAEATPRKRLPCTDGKAEVQASMTPAKSQENTSKIHDNAGHLADSNERFEAMLAHMDEHPESYALPAKLAYDITAYDGAVLAFIAQKEAQQKPIPSPCTSSPVGAHKVAIGSPNAIAGRSSPPVPPKPLKLKFVAPIVHAAEEVATHSSDTSGGETSPSVKEMRSFFEQKIKENAALERPSSPTKEKKIADEIRIEGIAA